MVILCLTAYWEMEKTERVCSECGAKFNTRFAAQSQDRRPEVACGFRSASTQPGPFTYVTGVWNLSWQFTSTIYLGNLARLQKINTGELARNVVSITSK
jgi:hypothetical protein